MIWCRKPRQRCGKYVLRQERHVRVGRRAYFCSTEESRRLHCGCLNKMPKLRILIHSHAKLPEVFYLLIRSTYSSSTADLNLRNISIIIKLVIAKLQPHGRLWRNPESSDYTLNLAFLELLTLLLPEDVVKCTVNADSFRMKAVLIRFFDEVFVSAASDRLETLGLTSCSTTTSTPSVAQQLEELPQEEICMIMKAQEVSTLSPNSSLSPSPSPTPSPNSSPCRSRSPQSQSVPVPVPSPSPSQSQSQSQSQSASQSESESESVPVPSPSPSPSPSPQSQSQSNRPATSNVMSGMELKVNYIMDGLLPMTVSLLLSRVSTPWRSRTSSAKAFLRAVPVLAELVRLPSSAPCWAGSRKVEQMKAETLNGCRPGTRARQDDRRHAPRTACTVMGYFAEKHVIGEEERLL
uniref:Rho-GAP domain-containing protein n=1 Tax=Macrostomum lignano TaxID=282301 RepID=A0A1I8FHY1_9PLAT